MKSVPIIPPARQDQRPQAWLVLTRPNNLPTALAAAAALADEYPGGCRLLLEDSPWWQHARWEEFRARFAAVHRFARVRAARGLFDVRRLHGEFAARQRALVALPFARDRDVLVCLAGVTELANAACCAYRPARRVLCLPHTVHDGLVRPPDRWRYRLTTASWVQNRLVEPLVGLERTLHFKPRVNRGGDGVRHVRLGRPPEAVYDAVVVMSNAGRHRPPGTGARTFPARFPTLDDLGPASPAPADPLPPDGRSVVFFGTPFLLVRNLSPADYAARLNDCLDYLRRSYPGCRWIYRPHPAENGEAAALRLDGFVVETDREAAELYFLRNFRRIAAVFSVSSTVSRVALNFGLPAHCFWRCFPFAQTQQRFFEKVMGDVPPGFELRDLSAPPCPPEAHAPGLPDPGPSLREALRTALASLPAVRVVRSAKRATLPDLTRLVRSR